MIRTLVVAVLLATAVPVTSAAQQVPTVPNSRAQIQLSYAPLVERTAPAVVNIFARKLVTPAGSPPAFGNTALWRLFSDALLFGFGARERVENSLGSGVIVDATGIVVTNHHVIESADGVFVGLSDERVFPAQILVSDKGTDLAVLKVETFGEALPTLSFGDSDELKVGDLVLAIGNPFGIGQTVTSGIVSALARTGIGIGDFRFFIQTDAAINPGNSGGAQVDMNGRLVGINTAIFSRSGGSLGIGFAVPSNMVRTVVDAALNGRSVLRPWLGVTGGPVPPQLAMIFGLQGAKGVFITGIHDASPAAKAGLVSGDIIFGLDDFNVPNFEALRYRIATRLVGDTVSVKIIRAGQLFEVDVALEAPPRDPPENERWLPGIHNLSGARVASMSPALAEELGYDSAIPGVVVLEVRRGSAAAKLGLQRGDIVRGIDSVETRTVSELASFRPAPFHKWVLVINRGGQDFAVEGG